MWELFAKEREIVTEIGQTCQMRYYILVEEAKAAGAVLCESYGIRIVAIGAHGVQSESLRHITFRLSEINYLIQKLAEHLVTPSALRDVVDDWIAAG